MILVDTSVWVDHLRAGHEILVALGSVFEQALRQNFRQPHGLTSHDAVAFEVSANTELESFGLRHLYGIFRIVGDFVENFELIDPRASLLVGDSVDALGFC